MLHTMKYSIRTLIRNKSQCFWLVLFPIILSTLFRIVLSNLGDIFETIPVAVVVEADAEKQYAESFCTVAENLRERSGEAGEKQLLKVIYCDAEEAEKMLKNAEVDGVITVGDRVSLSISAKGNSDRKKLNQSILNAFVRQYNLSADAIAEIALHHPDHLAAAVSALEDSISYNKEETLSVSAGDNIISYFYNLLAMTCMFGSMSGMYISLENQGNLSTLGARRNIAPSSKRRSILGEMAAHVLVNYACLLIGFAYIDLILGMDLADRLPLMMLTLFVSNLAGTAFGFFVGAIGNMSVGAKNSLLLAVSMFCCFLSGLMAGNMWIIVENRWPIVNRINLTALIADSFYCLAHFDNYARYTRNMLSLGAFTVLFLAGGFLLTRRRRYASL